MCAQEPAMSYGEYCNVSNRVALSLPLKSVHHGTFSLGVRLASQAHKVVQR
jgi:hypothetical protein